MKKLRIILGVICLLIATWIFIVEENSETIPPAIACAVVGITLITTSRKN
ncbi:MAG: hypothetical protein PHQ86_07580 [Dehalococcoidales bacterium]|nr:hypothetical protein [Dehalococcoidales bacterium]